MNSRAYFYLTVTSLFWGANSVAGKLAVGHISPMALTTFRWIVALLIILALMTPQDAPALTAMYRRLSAESIWNRFCIAEHPLSPERARQFATQAATTLTLLTRAATGAESAPTATAPDAAKKRFGMF